MSNRTIVELNHDFASNIEDDPETFIHKLVCYLRSQNNDDRVDLKHRFGVTVSVTAHHSDDRRVKVNETEYTL